MRVVNESIQKHGSKAESRPFRDRFLREYKNPRKLPTRWLENYLDRDSERLASDVMLVYDEKVKLEKKLERANLKVWILSLIVSPLIGEGVKFLYHLVK